MKSILVGVVLVVVGIMMVYDPDNLIVLTIGIFSVLIGLGILVRRFGSRNLHYPDLPRGEISSVPDHPVDPPIV